MIGRTHKSARPINAALMFIVTMLMIFGLTSLTNVSKAWAFTYTPTPGCDYSVANQVSCTFHGQSVLIKAGPTNICYSWSGYSNDGSQHTENYEVYSYTWGSDVTYSAVWYSGSYSVCKSVNAGDELGGYASINYNPTDSTLKVEYKLVAGSQGSGGGGGCPVGETHIGPGTPAAPAAVVDQNGCSGYYLATNLGGVSAFGAAVWHGDVSNIPLNKPVVGIADTKYGQGYWMVASDGGIFTEGNAHFYGSTGNIRLAQPVVGMAATPDSGGYWLVASDGGIFTFGNAHFYGSTGNIRLNQPMVGMAATGNGAGYWMVASDGGIFTFGNAGFYGSLGNIRLNKPVVGMVATSDGKGYWMVASDGGVFAFGDAHFVGSLGGRTLPAPIRAMAATPSGMGYYLNDANGNVYAFGDASCASEPACTQAS